MKNISMIEFIFEYFPILVNNMVENVNLKNVDEITNYMINELKSKNIKINNVDMDSEIKNLIKRRYNDIIDCFYIKKINRRDYEFWKCKQYYNFRVK